MTSPYTHEELREMKRRLEESIDRTERDHPDARGLPPMAEAEVLEMLLALTDAAEMRALTHAETFLFGQLLASYRMAVEARMLGHNGRFYVINESFLDKIQKEREGDESDSR